MKITSKILVILLLLSTGTFAQSTTKPAHAGFINYEAIQKYSHRSGNINDFESILTTDQKHDLDAIIKDFEKKTTNQIVIVTVASFQPFRSLKDFTTDLGNLWSVGDPEKENGLIISVSKTAHKVSISMGKGTGKSLTNEKAQKVIDTKMIPKFKDGEYYEGIKAGLLEYIRIW
jgi:uncharacterized protein